MSNRTELVIVLDENGTALKMSEEHALLLGYKVDELVGKCAFAFVHPADVDDVREKFQRMVCTNQEITAKFRFRHKSGKWVVFESRGVPLIDEGCLQGFVVVSHEHRRLDLKALIQKLEFVPAMNRS